MAGRKDPYRNFRFLVEIDGIVQAGFSEVTVPDTSTDVVEYREGSEEPRLRKLSGLNKFGNVTLKWGTTDSLEFFNWRKLVMQGKMKDARKNMAVILMDEEGNPAARWEFENAWPNKYDPADLNAKGNDVAIESVEIVHEGMKRVS
ncbi:phage tail protein [Geobacter sulfurreducens]|jgi:phage tail-like protein|uniref:Phage tail tube protein gp19, putative n=3 Tax=Geobacter TaxID=28231 RepID=Q74EI6_GEOSL|nr:MULTISPECIES: phage tail protein [Geobacter]BET58863.1 phage tail protein [Geobacter sp. 60473]AAR34303.1 phage tail tube protein gp19, putative [Geobacter sulfurreducens PCA]ADI83818.1 phage tail tube protein gp19, putative [Geobacter sulfurreducens KN400]AJY70710.1 phage tail protein [Geobacter sulfurreducens]ANA40853.1 phage tail protein [Geobacter anodireducens]